MYSLILDTSNRTLGVALVSRNRIVDSISFEAFRKQSELLIPEIKKLLTRNDLELSVIRKIYVSNGPGSYTGIRMSLAVAKTLAFANEVKIYLVSSLLAQVGYTELPTVSIIDARANRVYFGFFQGGLPLQEEMVLTLEEAKAFIEKLGDIDVISNSPLELFLNQSNSPKDGIIGISEVLKFQKSIKDPLRVEPFYFKDAVV